MNKIKFQVALAFIFLLVQNSYGQESTKDNFSTNVVHASLGTLVFANSANINYDLKITSSNKGFFKAYYASFGGGFTGYWSFTPGGSGSGYTLSTGVTGLTGLNKYHFEARLGLGYYKEIYTGNELDDLYNTLYPNINLGYRYQKPEGGFVLRSGVGLIDWVYVSFGYSF